VVGPVRERAVAVGMASEGEMADVGEAVRPRRKHREALLKAARTLFRARGFEATTIDEIVAAAGVSRRTFFRYFETKDAVVFPNADERIARFAALLRPGADRPDEAPLDALRRAVEAMAADFAANRDELLLQDELIRGSPALLAREHELDRRWEAAIAEALGGDLEARVRAGALTGGLRAALRGWLADGGRQDLAALATGVLHMLGVPHPDDAPGPRRRRSRPAATHGTGRRRRRRAARPAQARGRTR
jgi:AcrR family transcriptional regulator